MMGTAGWNRLKAFLVLCLVLWCAEAGTVSRCEAKTIHEAAAEGDVAAVTRILDKDCMSLNQRDFGGQTPLITAAMYGQKQMVEFLLSRGADVTARDNIGRSAVFWAAQNGEASIVQLLVERGASVKDRDLLGWTPLHGAAMLGKTDMVPLLTQKYAEVNARDFRGRTPVDLAQAYDRPDTVKMLRKHGAIGFSPAALPMVAAGVFIFMIGFIWIVVAAFMTNVWWGLACTFLPAAPLVYVVFNADKGWRPFLVMLAGVAVLALGVRAIGLF